MNVSTDTENEVAGNEGVEVDAVATTVIEIGRQADGSHDDYESADEDEDEIVLIDPEYFDAGYVGSGDFELDEDADTDGVEDAEILIQELAPEAVRAEEEPTEGGAASRRAREAAAEVEALLAAAEAAEAVPAATEPVGARAAARRARQAEEAAVKAARGDLSNRRHGVLGVAMALVLAYQTAPAAVPGGQVGVNAFLGALGMTLWAMRGRESAVVAKGGRRRAEGEPAESTRRGSVLVGLGLALLTFAAFAPDPTNLGDRFAPLAMVAGLLLVVGVTAEPPGPAARALAVAPLRHLGRLSFALLGTLAVAFLVVPAVTGWSPNTLTRVVASLAALGAAALTMRQIERSNAAQIQRARHRNGHAGKTAAALAAVALGATAPGQLNDRQNADDFVAAVEAVALPAAPDPAAGLPFADRCWAIPPDFASATCTFGNDDANVSVALTGDQTAGSWLPALQGLALAKGWRVTTYLAADCMPGTTEHGACADWSKRVGKSISTGDYDLVVVAGDTNEKGGAFGEALRRDGMTVIGMPDLVPPTK